MTDSWELDLGILVALLVAIVLLALWLRHRIGRRDRARRLAGLREVAGQAGGHVRTGGPSSTPRSATLRPPFAGRLDGGWADTMSTLSRPAYDYALDVRRGHWPARAAQAHYTKAPTTTPGPVTLAEYRIEIAVSPCPSLKVAPVHPGEGNERELRQGPEHWSPVPLPPPFADRLQAFADDGRFASATLNQESLGWLTRHAGQFGTPLTIEQGVLHMTWPGEIDPARVVDQIDFLAGFLDRTPIRPGSPSASNSAAQAGPAGQRLRRHLTPARLYQLAGLAVALVVIVVTFLI